MGECSNNYESSTDVIVQPLKNLPTKIDIWKYNRLSSDYYKYKENRQDANPKSPVAINQLADDTFKELDDDNW